MTKRIIIVMMTVVLCAGAALAEDPYQVAWSAQVGTPSHEFGYGMAVDAAGNAYISGRTDGDLGGPNAGTTDAFLTKFDTSGNEIWSQQIGTSTSEISFSVAVDASGNSYIGGYTYGSLGGPNAGTVDAFLAKFDAAGNVLWSQQIGTSTDDEGLSLAVDTAGNSYITGYTKGDLGGTNAGRRDAFLTKFDAAGNELWSQQIGTSGNDSGQGVAIDAAGNAYITGYAVGNLGGPLAGQNDAFLIKFDTSGNELWHQQIGTPDSDVGYSVATDTAGNAYIVGATEGSLGGLNAGGQDAFLVKFDTSGNELWRQQIGTASDDYGLSVAVDTAGNAYISGHTFGDLGGTNAGGLDAFLTKFDAAGNVLWSQQAGTASGDDSNTVAIDAAGNVYISGTTGADLGGANVGGYDAFLIKYEVPEPATISLLAMGGLALLRRRKK